MPLALMAYYGGATSEEFIDDFVKSATNLSLRREEAAEQGPGGFGGFCISGPYIQRTS